MCGFSIGAEWPKQGEEPTGGVFGMNYYHSVITFDRPSSGQEPNGHSFLEEKSLMCWPTILLAGSEDCLRVVPHLRTRRDEEGEWSLAIHSLASEEVLKGYVAALYVTKSSTEFNSVADQGKGGIFPIAQRSESWEEVNARGGSLRLTDEEVRGFREGIHLFRTWIQLIKCSDN